MESPDQAKVNASIIDPGFFHKIFLDSQEMNDPSFYTKHGWNSILPMSKKIYIDLISNWVEITYHDFLTKYQEYHQIIKFDCVLRFEYEE
jgi:hypothetical protein